MPDTTPGIGTDQMHTRLLARVVRIVAMLFVVGWAIGRWDPQAGFSAMPRFGEQFADRRLPALAQLPIANAAGEGYDGQWYAQLAVDPRVTDSTVVRALDKPAYRARRILLPAVANLLGMGSPWRTIQLFVLLHIFAWAVLAIVLWRRLPTEDWRATAAWGGAVLSTGALDSVRMTLTDLPAALLVVLAVLAVERGRTSVATAWMVLAGFTRELSLGALLALQRRDDPWWGGWAVWRARALVALPVLAWCGWLLVRTPGVVGHEGNIAFPGAAFLQHMAFCVNAIAGGDHDNQWWFGLAGGVTLAAQSVYLLWHWRSAAADPWLAMAILFALLFWVIGPDPWIDYRAVSRDCLPMTIGFAVHWWRTRGSPAWLVALAPIVLDGLIRTTWP